MFRISSCVAILLFIPSAAALADSKTDSISLDGTWRCAPDPFGIGRKLGYDKPGNDAGWRDANVPGTVQELGPEFIAYAGLCWYHRRITIPADWAGRRITLAGEGLYDRATVWIDGQEAGVVDLSYLPWEVEVHAQPGAEIQIAIEIDNRFNLDRAPGRIIGWRPLAGLLRPVRLQARPWTTVGLSALSTAANGTLSAAVHIKRRGNKAPAADRVRWHVETLDGKELGGGEEQVANGTAKFQSRLAGARDWTPESPILHRLVVDLLDARGDVVDRLERRFGFRRIAVENGQLCLDGRPLSLAGANLHEDRPEAPFRWHESVRADLKQMIEAGANCVRLCHYPQDPRVLDACDELGLLVLPEVPLWGSNPKGEGHTKRVAHARAQLETLIRRDLHHACVLLWSVSNETDGGRADAIAANRELVQLARRLDPSRPATHVSHTWDKHPDFTADDVVCINGYPSWLKHSGQNKVADAAQWWRENLAALAKACPNKPIIITEFGHPALTGGAAALDDEPTQAASIAHESTGFDHPAVCGTIIWCWADHLWPVGQSGLTVSPFGLLTRDRHPKPALAEAEKVWRQRRSLPSRRAQQVAETPKTVSRASVQQEPPPSGAQSISLDGSWRCAPDPFGVGRKLGYDKPGSDADWREATVPGTVQDLGPEFMAYNGSCWYRRRITIPADWAGQRITLGGEGLYDRATIWIDGAKAGVVDLPYLPWEVEVRGKPGAEVQVAIEIDSKVSMDRAPGRIIAWRPISGLLRSVHLQARPWTTVALSGLSTAGDGSLAAAVRIDRHGNKSPAAERVRWLVETLDGKKLSGGEAQVAQAAARIETRLANVRPWTPESPVLHRLVVELLDERGAVVDRLERRFGFRRIAVENGRLCLDGKPIMLAGANMHEDRPEALFRWDESVRADLKRMLQAGANCVRLTCYPNDPRTLDACDELGLLVLSEVPLFGSNGAGTGHDKRVGHVRAQLEAMIARDLHHASIVLWLVSCETNIPRADVPPTNRDLVETAHRCDPSRLASHISHTWDKTHDFVADDVVCVNGYPTWLMNQGTQPVTNESEWWRQSLGIEKDSPQHIAEGAQWWRKNLAALANACPGKPIIITEFGHPALVGVAGRCDEAAQAAAIAQEAKGFDHPAVCGTIVWCWADHLWPLGYGFMSNLAESPFGLLTRDRKPKPALAEAERVWRQIRSKADGKNVSADLASGFANPPDSDRPWVYWWWLDGAASKEGITRDLEEMRRQGIGGFILVDAGVGGPDAPKGPPFMSEPWRENFRHAVRDAGRLGLLMSVNLCSGWDAGGPWIQNDDAIKHLTTSEITVQGPAKIDRTLPQPHTEFNWYRDIAVLACRLEGNTWKRGEMVDLTGKTRKGRLQWDAPDGRWTVLRLGYTLNHGRFAFGVSARTKYGSNPESAGWEADPWSKRAMDRHFAATAGKLIEDAGALAGKALVQVHIDSWETASPTWSGTFLQEFQERRGYDARPFLPALSQKTVDSSETTARFLWDYQRTAADLFAANHYGRLGELARSHGLAQDSQSGGPFFGHSIDALQCEGLNEIPMGEFWKRTWEPDGPVFGTPEFYAGYDTVRQAASAAHIYGRKLCAAEAFTSWSEDWIDDPCCLKDVGDQAFCAGLTRPVIHGFLTQTRLDVVPGNQWAHVGTHLNPDVTWWNMSHAWLLYLRRCQYMLRQGLFVADLAYFYGEDAHRFVRAKYLMEPALPQGYDCDTLNAEVLLTLTTARDGRMVLPDGMSYRYLVLPNKEGWKASPAVLTKIAELAEGGLTVIGVRPAPQAPGLTDFPQCDRDVARLVEKLWGKAPSATGESKIGEGRVVWGKTPAAVIESDRLAPDVEFRAKNQRDLFYAKRFQGSSYKPVLRSFPRFDWIHRRHGQTDIYFVSNQSAEQTSVEVAFRVTGRKPQLWDAVTGAVRDLPEVRGEGARTFVPMRFEPRQSFFVVFRPVVADESRLRATSFPDSQQVADLAGPWEVSFDPKWGGPERITFDALEDWTKRPQEGIRYYSGTAIYRKTFDLVAPRQTRLYLDLGTVKNVAQIKLNGKDLGVVWTAPWRVEITEAVQAKDNRLEITVANLWPNRLIGDAKLPPERRFTKTNVKTYQGHSPDFPLPGGCKACEDRQRTKDFDKWLLPSGLLGPVTVQREVEQ